MPDLPAPPPAVIALPGPERVIELRLSLRDLNARHSSAAGHH